MLAQVQLLEGYFVHFAAPDNLVPMPKHVVFVLDTSGSMRHRKMHQVGNITVCDGCEVRCTDSFRHDDNTGRDEG